MLRWERLSRPRKQRSAIVGISGVTVARLPPVSSRCIWEVDTGTLRQCSCLTLISLTGGVETAGALS